MKKRYYVLGGLVVLILACFIFVKIPRPLTSFLPDEPPAQMRIPGDLIAV